MKKFASCLLALSLTVPLASAAYGDVPSSSALAGEVQKAVDAGLMTGYSADRFGYADPMTRAQFAAVLVRMMGWATETGSTPAFRDVPASHRWYGVVETAVNRDVVDSGGSFRPDDAITRGEMSEMLVRALGLKSAAAIADKETSLPFTDVTSRRGYISVAYDIGMTRGTSATTFSPTATATRAQAAAMLVRIDEKRRAETDFVHGFYAISSYSQLELAQYMDAVSAGWSRMTWDGTAPALSTTSADGNEFCVPQGYQEVYDTLAADAIPLNLSVYMDTAGGLDQLLASPTGRQTAAEQILDTVRSAGIYGGVTIDFEGLRSAQRETFNAFLTTLGQSLHQAGKTLYVCVSPILTTGSYYDGYDYRAIGDVADKVILMAYDYETHDLSGYLGTEYYKTAATEPIGQVYAALRAITDADDGVRDVSKVALGFSRKNVAWQIDGDGKLLSGTPMYVSNDTLARRQLQADTVRGWSDTYQQPYAIYTTEQGSRYFVWYDDAASAAARLHAAKLLGVTGVSLWRLGTLPVESSDNWMGLLHQ